MDKNKNPMAFGKKYQVGDELIQIKTLSFFEMVSLPTGILSSFCAKLPSLEKGENVTPEQIVDILQNVSIVPYVTELLGITKEQMEKIPAALGVEMVADWIDTNLSENFLTEAIRIKAGGTRIYSMFARSSLSTGTDMKTSGAGTHSDKSKDISRL